MDALHDGRRLPMDENSPTTIVMDGETAGDYVRRRIMDIFQEVAEHVADGTFELDHPAPIIRGSIAMTNAWNNYIASLEQDGM